MVLLCYDGSADAKAAIERAGELLEGKPATVLTVWEPFMDVVARTPSGFGLSAGMVDVNRIDALNRQSAEQRAQEGAELARAAGLDAHPRTCTQDSTIARAIIEHADELDVEAIVMGTRGLTGVKSLLVGSVSHAVVNHADRAVVVVPSPDVATARNRQLHAEHEHT